LHLGKTSTILAKSDIDELARWSFIGVKLTLGKPTAEKVKKGILRLK
jgi:hypothetical protein